MATNHLVESTPQVKVEGVVIDQMEVGSHLDEDSENTEEEEDGKDAHQESNIEQEKEMKRNKNSQNKPLVLEERVRMFCSTGLE